MVRLLRRGVPLQAGRVPLVPGVLRVGDRVGEVVLQLDDHLGGGERVAGGFRESMIDLLGYTTRHVPRDVVARGWAELTGHAAAGRIAVEVERAPLAEVAAVWRRQAGFAHRKLVLVP